MDYCTFTANRPGAINKCVGRNESISSVEVSYKKIASVVQPQSICTHLNRKPRQANNDKLMTLHLVRLEMRSTNQCPPPHRACIHLFILRVNYFVTVYNYIYVPVRSLLCCCSSKQQEYVERGSLAGTSGRAHIKTASIPEHLVPVPSLLLPVPVFCSR